MRLARPMIPWLLALLMAATPVLCFCRMASAATSTDNVPACCRLKRADSSHQPVQACPHCSQKDVSIAAAAPDVAVAPPVLLLPMLAMVEPPAAREFVVPASLLPGDSPPTLLSLSTSFRC